MGTLTPEETRTMLERMRLVESYFSAHPELRQQLLDNALAWIAEQATQLPGPLDHAKHAIGDAMWVAFVGGSHPVMTMVFRSTATGKETGELWVHANGMISAICKEPWMGEANEMARFNSAFPDEPQPGIQMQRAIEFMRCQGFEVTGETRTWPGHKE